MTIPAEIRKWIVLGVIIAAFCLTFAILSMCTAQDRQRASEARETMANARTEAAADVNDVRDKSDAKTAATNSQVKDIQDEIRSTDDPAERSRIAERGLCRIDPGSSPNCGMLLANP